MSPGPRLHECGTRGHTFPLLSMRPHGAGTPMAELSSCRRCRCHSGPVSHGLAATRFLILHPRPPSSFDGSASLAACPSRPSPANQESGPKEIWFCKNGARPTQRSGWAMELLDSSWGVGFGPALSLQRHDARRCTRPPGATDPIGKARLLVGVFSGLVLADGPAWSSLLALSSLSSLHSPAGTRGGSAASLRQTLLPYAPWQLGMQVGLEPLDAVEAAAVGSLAHPNKRPSPGLCHHPGRS